MRQFSTDYREEVQYIEPTPDLLAAVIEAHAPVPSFIDDIIAATDKPYARMTATLATKSERTCSWCGKPEALWDESCREYAKSQFGY